MICRPQNAVRIALVGGPGTGKTTTATAFAAYMKDKGFNWYYVAEYAREFIDNYGAKAVTESGPLLQLHFVEKQWRRELNVPNECDGFVTDSPVFISWVYASIYGNKSVGSYLARKNNYKAFLRSIYEYTHIVIVKREKEYVKDGCRMQTEEEALRIDNIIETLLIMHGVKYHTISGSLEERMEQLDKLAQENLIVA